MALFSALIACLYMYSLVDALIDILTFTLNIRYLLKSNVLYETISELANTFETNIFMS